MEEIHTKACFLSHMGEWMMKEDTFTAMSSLIITGEMKVPVREDIGGPLPEESNNLGGRSTGEENTVQLDNGILIVPISGMTMLKESKFGGTSTIRLKKIMNLAASDPEVKGAMLKIDSPGGHVEGNHAAAAALNAFGLVKPLFTHSENTMASAAIWLGLQASRVSASPMATVGSLGTVMTIFDFSKQFKADGVKAHVISTGKFKGMGSIGSEVTREHLAFLEARVEELNRFFKDAVMESRGFTQAKVNKLFDGSFGLAQKALDDGLIDEVETFEEALVALDEFIKGGEFNRLHRPSDHNGRKKSAAKIEAVVDDQDFATMDTDIKQNNPTVVKESRNMEEIKSVADMKQKFPQFCNEIAETASKEGNKIAVDEAMEAETNRVSDWLAYSDVDPIAVKAGIESKKSIGIPEATDLAIKRKDPAFKAALVDENPDDVVTPEANELDDAASDDKAAVNKIIADAEKFN